MLFPLPGSELPTPTRSFGGTHGIPTTHQIIRLLANTILLVWRADPSGLLAPR